MKERPSECRPFANVQVALSCAGSYKYRWRTRLSFLKPHPQLLPVASRHLEGLQLPHLPGRPRPRPRAASPAEVRITVAAMQRTRLCLFSSCFLIPERAGA